jgi:hypothetical protein
MSTSRNPDNFHIGFDGLINFYRGKIEPDAHGLPRRVNARDRAAVYGEVCRYSQMRDGECWARIEIMAYEIDIARSAFKYHLDALVRDEFVIRLQQSKGGRGKTSRYVVSGKLAALNDILNRETLRVEEGIADVTLAETLRVEEGIEPETHRVEEGLERNPPRGDGNPPRGGGEETIGNHASKETKRDSGDHESAPSYSPTSQRPLITQLFGELAHDMRSFDYSTSEAELEARIEEDRRSGRARPNPIQLEEVA